MQELRKNREIQLNQQTIRCKVLADLIKIWSCLIFIKLYLSFVKYENIAGPEMRTKKVMVQKFHSKGPEFLSKSS